MEITERLLSDAGGWQTLKQARALHEIGRVNGATWEPPLLQGRVREGETEYRAGLKIISKSNVENLCGCRASRQHGAICAHSVAVGLEYLKPRAAAAAHSAPAPVAAPQVLPKTPGAILSLTEGEPMELHLVLPPQLEAAWLKGALTVGAEAAVRGKRILLTALPKDGTFRCDEADLRAEAALRKLANGALPGMMVLPAEKFLELLPSLAGHPRIALGRSGVLHVEALPFRPDLHIEQKADGAVHLRVEIPPGALPLLAGAQQPWLLQEQGVCPLAPGIPAPYHDLLRKEIVLPAEHAEAFLARELPSLAVALRFEAPLGRPASGGAGIAPPKPGWILHLEGSLNYLSARLEAQYPDRKITLPHAVSKAGGGPRNVAEENAAVERLKRGGFTGPNADGQFELKGEPRILAFFARELPEWERDATVKIGQRFGHVTRNVERVTPRFEIQSSGESWFDLHFELGTPDGERFSATEIQRLLQSGQSHVRRRDGKIAVFDPGMLQGIQDALQDCEGQQRQPGLFRIDRRNAAYLATAAETAHAVISAPESWRRWADAPRQMERLETVPLGPLEETLRPYQKQGVYWMNFLARNGLAGLLADEMGLGKTVQTLAVLRALGGRALIVCPSTLVFNWQREAARFTPDRRVVAVEGPDREKLFGKPIAAADIVITSYALLRRDADRYRDEKFQVAVLDEAQHIKNPESQNAQAAFGIQAANRFVLTGTPIENSLRDIWSLMHFLMPGYLGTRNDFKERFDKPIQLDARGPEQKRLLKRLQPFILRRTKKNVITELPDKVEQVALCELTRAQKAIYGELLSGTRRQVSELAGGKEQKKSRILILTALLRLRQACCDLRLLGDADPATASGKLEMLGELLQEAVDGGHRVLIFSQFVSMLKIIQAQLTEDDIESCYLDGSTRNRGAEVDRFQDGNAPVFLISLKAGGTGLNLTAADTVIHFDPWWNPAVEAQATDRAHRIGQEKVVTSYKLIARDTIEEKILALQARKKELSDLTVESEEPLMQSLTMGDIEALLE